MEGVVILWSIAGFFFTVSIAAFVFALVLKERVLYMVSLGTFILMAATGAFGGYLFVTKAIDIFQEIARPRTGMEIYEGLFESPQTACVEVLHHQDQVAPVLDDALWLHVKTCPEEIERILGQQPYSSSKKTTEFWNNMGPLANEQWYKPELLGDTVWAFQHEQGRLDTEQIIYTNLDSTEAYIKDIML